MWCKVLQTAWRENVNISFHVQAPFWACLCADVVKCLVSFVLKICGVTRF